MKWKSWNNFEHSFYLMFWVWLFCYNILLPFYNSVSLNFGVENLKRKVDDNNDNECYIIFHCLKKIDIAEHTLTHGV